MTGLWFALVIALLGLSIAAYLALQDQTVVASVVGGTTLVGLVAAFIVGKSTKEPQ